MNCKTPCIDKHATPGEALWHRAYCNWYDHDRAGNRVRAAMWGWTADRLVLLTSGRLRHLLAANPR